MSKDGIVVLTLCVGCYYYICSLGFSYDLQQRRGIAVPRLNRNVVCINLIYSYYILFFSRFDTAKFPQNYDIQK
ncbi:hypothetical protein D1647_20360 [Alistipes sp. Z76]|nr:hypothetical protein [Alistipes sp. Z76]